LLRALPESNFHAGKTNHLCRDELNLSSVATQAAMATTLQTRTSATRYIGSQIQGWKAWRRGEGFEPPTQSPVWGVRCLKPLGHLSSKRVYRKIGAEIRISRLTVKGDAFESTDHGALFLTCVSYCCTLPMTASAGLYDKKEIRPVNEARMLMRWKLGRVLVKVEPGTVPGTGRGHKGGKSKGKPCPIFKSYLVELNLRETTAKEAQRIGALPNDELKRKNQAKSWDVGEGNTERPRLALPMRVVRYERIFDGRPFVFGQSACTTKSTGLPCQMQSHYLTRTTRLPNVLEAASAYARAAPSTGESRNSNA
jgi:hypothetical protein